MLSLFFLLIIVPLLLGALIRQLLKPLASGPFLFCFAIGFLIMVAEFALICYPSIYFDIPFHIVCNIVCSIYLVESLAIILWLLFTKKTRIKNWFSKESLLSLVHSPSFWIMILLCGLQIIRLIVFEPYQIRDSKTYNALVNDVLQSDHLFRTYHATGFPIESVLDMSRKYFLSPWYPFMSMLARMSRLHSLIIVNTILPAYTLLLSYFFLYSLGYYLFNKETKSACLFTTLCAFIREVTLYCHTPTMIALVWPVWGKGVLSMTVVPAILVIYMLYADKFQETGYGWFCLILLLLVVAGFSMSTMGALVLPMELGILGLIWTIRHRSVRILICSLIPCLPAVLYLAVFYYCSLLQ